ncbi:hypothetical protein [uncultured Albimonas sp.]|uniref:hypothetical protein n=1 Tax=uncultured Albimonas sp. TaxID=1331701 RepID=UPI0030ECF9CF
MEFLTSMGIALAAGVAIFAALAAVAWTWDTGLPKDSAASLARALARPGPADEAPAREASAAFLRAVLGPEAPFARFAGRAAAASAGALAAMTLIWFLSIPDLPASFLTDGASLRLVLRQVILNGFVSAFAITWASWTVAGARIGRLAGAGPGRLALHLALDLLLRLALLMALSTVIFALFARFAGSFGGSVETAVAVVPETLVSALAFRALSGAQVYAALLTGFPWLLLLTLRLAPRPWTGALWRQIARALPIEDKPFRFLGILLAGVLTLCGLTAALLLRTLRDAALW